jgi:two-component system, chemotaxis family, chemotaxis protein CheY
MPDIRALIVDDSSVMRKIVERSLRQAGVKLTQVLEAGNGAEALVVLEQSHVRSRVRRTIRENNRVI